MEDRRARRLRMGGVDLGPDDTCARDADGNRTTTAGSATATSPPSPPPAPSRSSPVAAAASNRNLVHFGPPAASAHLGGISPQRVSRPGSTFRTFRWHSSFGVTTRTGAPTCSNRATAFGGLGSLSGRNARASGDSRSVETMSRRFCVARVTLLANQWLPGENRLPGLSAHSERCALRTPPDPGEQPSRPAYPLGHHTHKTKKTSPG